MQQNNFIINLIASLQKSKSEQQVKTDVKNLGDIYVKLIGNLDMPKTRQNIKNQLKEFNLNNNSFTITPAINTKGVQNAAKQAVNNAQRVANNNSVQLRFDTDKQKLLNQIKIIGKSNSKLFNNPEMTAKYNQILNSANIAKSKSELKALRGQLSAFKTELVATNNVGLTWGDKFKASISRYAQFFSGASFVYAMANQLRNAATSAKELDDRLVDLQKVTDEITDRDALYKYFDRAMSKAQDLNVKVDSLIYAITEFKKLGWSLSDAELGGEWATILENVGDVSIDTAIGSIKTAIASFDEIGGYTDAQMDKKLEAYTDLINNMSNKYSIDAEGLAEAIRLSAGTLTEAHTSIEQAATMFATANRYYNDPSYLGHTVKIGSLRMRASEGDSDAIAELENMGEEIDNLAEATSSLREKLLALTGVDIMIDEHTFKSYYDQLYEISQVIDELDDTSRANVLETLFGKNRSAGGAALLSGMKESADAYKDAINSAGSATEEYKKWMQSADAASQRFANNLTQTYQSIISGNTVRDIANIGSAVLEFANNWGIVEGTLKGLLVLGIGKFLTTTTMAVISATKSVEQYGRALQLANNIPNGNLAARFTALKSIASITDTLTNSQLKQVLSSQSLTQQDRIRILQLSGLTKEMALQKLTEMGLTQATNAQTAANAAGTASAFSLKAAMAGLGATMKSVFLSNPVGIALMAVSVGVSAITSAVSKHNQKMEEMRDKAKEAADEANTLGDEIAELANKYISLSEAVKTDASAKEDLMTTQTELLKKLGLEGESIDDLIEKYGSLSNAIRQASIDSLKNSQIDLIAGVNAASEELLDVAKDNFWGTRNIINATGKDAVKAFKELEKAGIVSSGSYGSAGGSLVLIGDETVEGALENYKRLEDAVNALRDSEVFTGKELSENSLFQAIYGRYSEMKNGVEEYRSAIEDLNENLSQQTMLTALQGQEIPKTEEEFNTFRQELVDTAVASKQFIGNEKDITDAINNYLSSVPDFEGYYSIPLENEYDKVNELLSQENYSKIKHSLSDLLTEEENKKLDSITSKMSSLGEAYQKLTSGSYTNSDILQLAQDFGITADNAEDLADLVKGKLNRQINKSIGEINELEAGTDDPKVLGQLESVKNALIVIGNEAKTAQGEVDAALRMQPASDIDTDDTLNALDDVKAAVSSLGSLYDEYKDKDTKAFSLDSISSLNKEMGELNLSSYKEFVDYLNETGNKADKADKKLQKMFDGIISEYISASGILDTVTDENKNIIENILRQWGVRGADKVVKQAAEANRKYEEEYRIVNENEYKVNGEKVKGLKGLYEEYYNALLKSDYSAMNEIEDIADDLINSLSGSYKTDLENWKDLLEKKKEAYSSFNKDVRRMGSEYDPDKSATANATSYIINHQNISDMDRQSLMRNAVLKDQADGSLKSQSDKVAKKEQSGKYKKNKGKGRLDLSTISLEQSDASSSKSKDSSKTKKTKEEIDWIARYIERLNSKIDLASSKLENLFAIKAKKNNLDTQIKQTTKLIKAYGAAIDKYAKKADSINLSSDLKRKVQNGQIKGSYKELIKKYGEETAKRISRYQDYYDKSKSAEQSRQEAIAQKRSLKEQQYQLYVDKAQAKIDKSNAAVAIASGGKTGDFKKRYKEENKELKKQQKYLEASYKYQIKIAKLSKDKVKAAQLEAELTAAVAENEKQQFENIQKGFENEISLSQARTSRLNAQISLTEAKGETVKLQAYEKQKAQEQERLSLMQDEEQQLEAQLENITKGTDAWYEAKEALISVRTEIANVKTEIVNTNAAVTELADTANEKLRASMQSIADEASFLQELFQDEEKFSDGDITEYGIGSLGSYVIGMDTADRQRQSLQDLISDMKEKRSQEVLSFVDANGFKRDYDSVEQMDAAIQELYENWRESIKSTNEYESKIADMMKQKYQAELDALNELIDARKSALQSAKDLHDYQNSIKDSTKNIASIQKQIAAIQGDTSEEGTARVQKLQKELADAQEELNEKEYDRYISDQQDMLDELYEQYEDLIQDEMKDTRKMLEKGIKCFNDNFSDFTAVYKDTAEKYSYDYENSAIASIISNTASGTTAASDIKAILETVYAGKLKEAQASAGETSVSQSTSTSASSVSAQTSNNTQPSYTPGATQNTVGGEYNEYKDVYAAVQALPKMEKGKASEFSISVLKRALHVLGFDKPNAMTDAEVNEGKWGTKLEESISRFKLYKGLENKSTDVFGETAKNALLDQLKIQGGFKTGGIAEIVKAKGEDGIAMVRNGEGILTPEQAKTFTDGLVPRLDSIIDASNALSSLPAPVNKINAQPVEANFEFNLEHVNNAQDMLQQIRSDRTIQKALQDVTIGQIAGTGTRLSVNKYH